MRIRALLLALAAALPAAADARSATSTLELRVVIPKVLQLRLEDHPRGVRVTEQDVARGELVVHGPRVHVVANDRHGFVLRAELRDAAFSGFALEGLPAAIACECNAAHAAMSAPGRRIVAPVAYRLRLAPGTQPGEYRWPMTLSLQDP